MNSARDPRIKAERISPNRMASRCALGGILGRKVTNVWGHPKCATAPNTKEGEPYTQPQVPSFIPRAFEMDAFTYNVTARTAVMRHDMNRVLVQNKASAAVLPFH